jgi:hypothetical protein
MTQHHRELAALHDALAGLYADEASACRDAGLDVRQIAFSTHAVNNWTAILDEAEQQTAVPDLVAVARKEYPKNAPLLNAAAAYEQAWPAVTPPTPPASIGTSLPAFDVSAGAQPGPLATQTVQRRRPLTRALVCATIFPSLFVHCLHRTSAGTGELFGVVPAQNKADSPSMLPAPAP